MFILAIFDRLTWRLMGNDFGAGPLVVSPNQGLFMWEILKTKQTFSNKTRTHIKHIHNTPTKLAELTTASAGGYDHTRKFRPL